jgi:hypothetical protein
MSPQFLSLVEVLEFHDDLLRSFGGKPGIRDLALVESAVAMPQSGSGLETAARKVASGTMDKDGFAGVLENTYKRYTGGA